MGAATNSYVYLANGSKLRVAKGSFQTDYVGNVIYENGVFKRLLVDGGYYEGGIYYFYIRDHLGNNRVVANQSGSVVQSTQYYPFGMAFANGTGQSVQPYKYNGKELDSDRGLNLYDYGARWKDDWHFTTMDPLAEKYYSISPYAYVMNNPMKFVDIAGLYSQSILRYDPALGLYGGYRFTESAAHLLNLVSGVNRLYIDNAIIQKRAPGQYRPWYSADNGGGAITIGRSSINATIIFTENFFEDDPSAYNGNGFGQDIYSWLGLSSHEVGHLPQIYRLGGAWGYLSTITGQYVRNGHDDAPLEIEADKGYKVYRDFNSFINSKFGRNSLETRFKSNSTEGQKVQTITEWWNAYQDNTKKETKRFFEKFSSLEEGKYIWNGSQWVK